MDDEGKWGEMPLQADGRIHLAPSALPEMVFLSVRSVVGTRVVVSLTASEARALAARLIAWADERDATTRMEGT